MGSGGLTDFSTSLGDSSFRRRPESTRSARIKLALGASIALHAAVAAVLVSFRYAPAAPVDTPIEVTVVAAAGEPARAAPSQDAAMPEAPVPTPAQPDATAPVPVEAAEVIPSLPTAIVPQVPAPPEPEQIALTPPPPTRTEPTPAKVAPARPRVVRAAARVTLPPIPFTQGEGEAAASPASAPASVHASADALSAWQAALVAWLDAHRAYPETARQRGEQGAVGVRFTLTDSGDVSHADIQRGSGFTTLDDATLDMLRGAHLPAPPPGTDPARRTISVSIRYRLN
jgi:protein TonB